jgi:signal transduction histidine kinase
MRSPDVPAGKKPAGHAAVPRASARAPRRLRSLSLRNWPVSRRLVAVIVLAVVMGLVFGGLRVAAAVDTAQGFARTTQLAVLGEQVTALAQAMEDERDQTAAYDAAEGLDNPHGASGPAVSARDLASYQAAMTQAQGATNTAAATVQGLASQIGSAFPAVTQQKAQNVVTITSNLSGLRSEALQQASLSTVEAYSEEIADLFDLNEEINSSGDQVLADEVRTLGAISTAKDQASQQRAILYAALVGGYYPIPSAEQQALFTSGQLESADLISFESSATNSEQTLYLNTVAGLPVNAAELMSNYLQMTGSPNGPAMSAMSKSACGGKVTGLALYTSALGQGFCTAVPQVWYSDMSVTIDKMRSVEQALAGEIVARSQSLEHGARQSAEFTAAVTGGVLLVVLVATLLVARSLVEPLRRLQADALEVATVRLPEQVAELSEAADPQAALQIEPISVNSTDEIGKVARAFDQVHREALRLAGNEALLRGNLNTMFISLSRRSVPLIERLARMIDSLEQNEDDPDRLSNLFSMDHLVTRMRRNSENLLVLAGEEPVRKWSEPVPLADVARAATSEIEQYSRVVLNIQPGISVSGQAAADVVHLLAEIVENATMFSPRDTPVYVSGQELTSGGVLIEVRDSGVGVSPPRLSEMNWRLDNPPLIDVSVSRHMGLFAVSRLAARHGIRVRLRPVSPQGLSALVWLPGNLTGREPAVGYGDRPSVATQSDGMARMAGRRLSGRHRFGLRAAEEGQLGIGPGEEAGIAASNWFRPKRPSPATGPQQVVAGAVPQQPDGVPRSVMGAWSGGGRGNAEAAGGWDNGQVASGWDNGQAAGGWDNAQAAGGWDNGRGAGGWDNGQEADWQGGQAGGGWGAEAAGWGRSEAPGWQGGGAGWRNGQAVGPPVHGDPTAAGLPTRIPRANLFPGSAAGGPSRDAGAGDPGALPAWNQAPAGYDSPVAAEDTQPSAFPRPGTPRRSAEQARTRLSGFQLGNRDAQGRTPRAGEEASR